MSTGRMMAAVAAALLAAGVQVASAQHAAAPEHAPAASPAAAVEQILRKLSQDLAKTPGKSARPHAAVSHAAPPARLQLAWRISLTWPDALTAVKP